MQPSREKTLRTLHCMNGFVSNLKKWYTTNKRDLPWKKDRDPYKIWLSEIILQQTRVAQGTPYYLKFIQHFPNVNLLAEAKEEEVLKLWEGLGYYSRARNLHKAAKIISSKYQGKLPNTYNDLIGIPGIGPYTAAAIVSFAFDGPHAVVDGNVNRVISRWLGIEVSLTGSAIKRRIQDYTQQLLEEYNNPAEFNQAIMDFGATMCKPKPDCSCCRMNKLCQAYLQNKVAEIPLKKTKKQLKKRRFYFFILDANGKTRVLKRTKNDIWRGLFQFPNIETEIDVECQPLKALIENDQLLYESKLFEQKLSHQQIFASFYHVKSLPDELQKLGILVNKDEVKGFAFPRIITRYIETRML